MKGFRQPAASSKKEAFRAMETELKNVQTSLRITQMMTRQLLENNKTMSEDLGRAMNLISELQYKVLAVQTVATLPIDKLKLVADDLRLKDFNEASDKADIDEGFTTGVAVTPESTVILTSTTEGTDQGIFRSRIKLADCGVKDLIDAFMGREVGGKAIVNLNGVEHTVELLGIRQPTAPVVVEVPAVQQEQQA